MGIEARCCASLRSGCVMLKMVARSVGLAAMAVVSGALLFPGFATAGEFYNAWHSKNSSIVLDAYEYTPIDWTKMKNNKRLTAFINKASDGLSPKANCGRNPLCRVTWRRYAATKELYHTRKVLAKTLGMEWGAYHLARPGNPVAQAEHFLSFAKPDEDDLIALDIEHNDPKRWMSLSDAEIFARHIKMRTGRYPVLYTNHTTSKFIAANKHKYKLLSKLHLWYARYKSNITGVFPMGDWKSYTLWQFSSMVNCSDQACPWRINGAGNWIDVNVVAMSPQKLRAVWPFATLPKPAYPAQEDKAPETMTLVKTPKEKAPEIDTMTTASIAPAVTPVKFVKKASLVIEKPNYVLPSNMWIAADKVIKPKWRKGTVFAKRVEFLTSDMIVQNLKKL